MLLAIRRIGNRGTLVAPSVGIIDKWRGILEVLEVDVAFGVSGFCGGGILAASILEVDVRWHRHKVVDSSLCRWGHDRNCRRRWVEGLG